MSVRVSGCYAAFPSSSYEIFYKFSSYITENRLSSNYTAQAFNAVKGNNYIFSI
jgi:hypothetical protein